MNPETSRRPRDHGKTAQQATNGDHEVTAK